MATRFGAAAFGSLAAGFAGSRCRRPVRIRCRRDAAVGEFQIEPRARADAGGGMHGMPLFVAHQRKTARQHAAIGQRRQQLPAMGDPRVQPLHRRCQRAPRALGQPQHAFAVARDGLALRLRIGEF